MRDNALTVTDRADLAGLSEEQIASYQQDDGTYSLPLLNFTNQPLQAQLTKPETRRALLAASTSRGLGARESSDTRQIVIEIATLRARKAALLGMPHHSEVVAQRGMAKESQAIINLLTTVAAKAVAAVDREVDELRPLAEADEGGERPLCWRPHLLPGEAPRAGRRRRCCSEAIPGSQQRCRERASATRRRNCSPTFTPAPTLQESRLSISNPGSFTSPAKRSPTSRELYTVPAKTAGPGYRPFPVAPSGTKPLINDKLELRQACRGTGSAPHLGSG